MLILESMTFLKVGSGSELGRVNCLCTHLTSFGGDFFVAPNPIDFDKVWDEFRRLGQTGNYVVLATVCSMLGLYVVGLIFARRADKKDLSKVNKVPTRLLFTF